MSELFRCARMKNKTFNILYYILFALIAFAIVSGVVSYIYMGVLGGFDGYTTFLSMLYLIADLLAVYLAWRRNIFAFIVFLLTNLEDYNVDQSFGLTFHNMTLANNTEPFLMHAFFVLSIFYCIACLIYLIFRKLVKRNNSDV